MEFEDLLEQIGGLGRFQLLVIAAIYSHIVTSSATMLQMSFAGVIPDWYCLPPGTNATEENLTNVTLKVCSLNNSQTGFKDMNCHRHHFVDSPSTIMNEWDLVCDKLWVKATVTSIQMGGVLLGAILAGQLSDLIGRKKTLFFFAFDLSVFNFVTAFSVSWIMFGACRFVIGIGIGGTLVSTFPYPMEFMPIRWRTLCGVLPVWSIGVCVFALFSWWLKDWSYLHIATGVLGLLLLLVLPLVPESVRWLAVQDKLTEAHRVTQKIADTNRKPLPPNTKAVLQKLSEREKNARVSGARYSYLDLFRSWDIAKITLTFCYIWFTMSIVYYGIYFGVSSLAGNLYLNIFLMAVIEVPFRISTFYFNNKIGRKWTGIILFSVTCVASFACLAVEVLDVSDKGSIISGLSLTAGTGIISSWGVMQTWAVEQYPTVIRSLGYGAANTAAMVGGILAPFVIDFDSMIVVSYIVIGCLTLFTVLLALVTPETKHLPLADSIGISITGEGDDKSYDVTNSYPKITEKSVSENEQGEYPISKLNGKTPIENKGFQLEPENPKENS